MTDREKLVELIQAAVDGCAEYWAGLIADSLIANGVTFQQWIPVTERLPDEFVSALVHMPDEKPFSTVREGFVSNGGVWHSAYFDRAHFEREAGEVTHWMPLPKPPKGE